MKPSNDIWCCLLIPLLTTCEPYKQEKTTSQVANDSTKVVSTEMIIDPVEVSCYRLSEGGRIKPLKLNEAYKGKIILSAQYDSLTQQFRDYQIRFGLLTNKQSGKEYLTYYSGGGEPVPAKLAALLPRLMKHLEYVKLEKTNYEDCTTPRIWGFPVVIE